MDTDKQVTMFLRGEEEGGGGSDLTHLVQRGDGGGRAHL